MNNAQARPLNIISGTPEDEQISSYQNGTFQNGPKDSGLAVTISLDVIDYPDYVKTEQELIDYLSTLLSPLSKQGCNVSIITGQAEDN